MTIYCKLCNHSVHSVKPDIEAQAEVVQALVEHLGRRHPHDAQMLAEDMEAIRALLATYLLLKHFVRIPVEEKTLQQSYLDNEQALLNLFDISNVAS